MATKLQRSYLPTSGASRAAAICCLAFFCVGLGFGQTVSAGPGTGGTEVVIPAVEEIQKAVEEMEGSALAAEIESEQKRQEDMYRREVERENDKRRKAIDVLQAEIEKNKKKRRTAILAGTIIPIGLVLAIGALLGYRAWRNHNRSYDIV